jgi:hypothetical protein
LGWYIEVEHPSGYVHTPTVLTGQTSPQRNPVAKGLPTITIPVRQDERWSDESFNDAPMRVWKDGDRQPVDRLETVEQTEGVTILRGRGGLALQNRYQAEINQQRTAALAREAIAETTGYTPNVDAPETTREDGVALYTARRDGDFESRLARARSDPVIVEDGAVKLAQTAFPQDAVSDGVRPGSSTDGTDTTTGGAYNEGVAARLDAEDERLRFTFETGHGIPAKHVGIKIRDFTPSVSLVRVLWDGVELSRVGNTKGLSWHDVAQRFESVAGPIRAGEEHELVFEVAEEYSDYRLDVVALYDKRQSLRTSFPNPDGGENQSGALAGPELYPHLYPLPFEAFVPPRAVVGGHLDADGRGDGSGIGSLGMTNGEASSYKFTYDTDEPYEIGFDDPGPEIRPRVTLERYGDDPDRDTIPTTGFETQHLTRLSLSADLEDVPLTVNQSFDNSLESVLSTLADDANAVWEFRREGDVESVEWTQLGQRVPDRTPEISSYSTTKDNSKRVEKAVVYGGTRDITNEYHYVTDASAPIALKHDRLQQATVTVVGTTSGVEMDRSNDYTVDHAAGEIVPQAGGRINDGDGLDVSYSFQTYGKWALEGVVEPRETVVDATGLVSDFAATQAAKAIVDELSEPLHRGTLTVSGDEVGFSVVSAIAAADLPGTAGSGLGGLQIKEVEHEPGEARIRFGSRRTIESVVDDFESAIAAVSRET